MGRDQVGPLSQRHTVVRHDLRGYGRCTDRSAEGPSPCDTTRGAPLNHSVFAARDLPTPTREQAKSHIFEAVAAARNSPHHTSADPLVIGTSAIGQGLKNVRSHTGLRSGDRECRIADQLRRSRRSDTDSLSGLSATPVPR